jgi:secreted trypsin-like serine protease
MASACRAQVRVVVLVFALIGSARAVPHAQPVTNGSPAVDDPAVVALITEADELVCTGAVIGAHTVITAAHCVVPLPPAQLRVFLGGAVGQGGVIVEVAHARAHPGFDPGGRDIALLTLREPVAVPPLQLEASVLDGSLVGTAIRVVGFGLSAAGTDDAGSKREGVARIATVRAEELVAVPDPSLSCLGDSGGPALLPAGTIAGVVSRVDSGCRDHAVYSRVDTARDAFIDPYLAATAPGTAALGDPCYYEAMCAEGSCAAAGDDPHDRQCTLASGCGGCASAQSMPAAAPSIIVMLGGAVLARRRRRRHRAPRVPALDLHNSGACECNLSVTRCSQERPAL